MLAPSLIHHPHLRFWREAPLMAGHVRWLSMSGGNGVCEKLKALNISFD